MCVCVCEDEGARWKIVSPPRTAPEETLPPAFGRVNTYTHTHTRARPHTHTYTHTHEYIYIYIYISHRKPCCSKKILHCFHQKNRIVQLSENWHRERSEGVTFLFSTEEKCRNTNCIRATPNFITKSSGRPTKIPEISNSFPDKEKKIIFAFTADEMSNSKKKKRKILP